jgi:regulator of protease activity HflC (stomatin/prohibitin superfamily)
LFTEVYGRVKELEDKLVLSMPRSDAMKQLMEKDTQHRQELAKLATRAESAEQVTAKLDEMAKRLGVMLGDVVSLKISNHVRDQDLKNLWSAFDKSVKAEVDKVKQAAAAEKEGLEKRIVALEQEKVDKEANLASREDEQKRKEAVLANLLLQLKAR